MSKTNKFFKYVRKCEKVELKNKLKETPYRNLVLISGEIMPYSLYKIVNYIEKHYPALHIEVLRKYISKYDVEVPFQYIIKNYENEIGEKISAEKTEHGEVNVICGEDDYDEAPFYSIPIITFVTLRYKESEIDKIIKRCFGKIEKK